MNMPDHCHTPKRQAQPSGGRRPRVCVLIPALNEAQSIADVLSDVRRHLDAEMVVIDDASTDETAAVAASCGAVVLSLPIRLGAWGAMRTGFRYVRNQRFDAVITMDADGQHRSQDLVRLVCPVLDGRADVVIGACTERGNWGRRMAWRLFRWLSGLAVSDLTSGFRVYSPAAVDVILGDDTALLDYQDIGVLLAMRKAGLRLTELPVTMCERRQGASRVYATWLHVMHYMAITVVLCLAKFDVTQRGGVRLGEDG
jgi:glycosyltransferase involved in cell wall biosynthesis